MKTKMISAVTVFAVTILFTTCDITWGGFGTIIGTINEMKYSIQVNNQAAGARSSGITAEDKVELNIRNFEYNEDNANRAVMLIAEGDRDLGSRNRMLNNAGWYSVHTELPVQNARRDIHPGPYSCFQVRISAIRINEKEYNFPNFQNGGHTVFFGNPPPRWNQGGFPVYPDNFPGINIRANDTSLRTIITVEPDIIGEPNSTGYDSQGLALDPYKFIKVEGRMNE